MMRFFSDRYGRYYPLSRVEAVLPPARRFDPDAPRETRYYHVSLGGDVQVEVADHAIDEVIAAPSTMIPAQPGTYLLGSVEADDGDLSEVWQTPVIAWSMGAADEVRPWTPDGPDDGVTMPSPVLMPNGMVIEQGDRSYRTLEEWFTATRDRKRAEQAKAGLGSLDETATGEPRSDHSDPTLA